MMRLHPLNLRNAHIGNRMDAREAWPAQGQLHLEGFAFGHLGAIDGDTGPQMRDREAKWWDNWARRDPDYSPATYAQLAAAFTNSGDRDAADDIRYLRREREREMACKEGRLGSCILQTALGSVAGYGIGSHTFNVIPWVLVFWLAGVALLAVRLLAGSLGADGVEVHEPALEDRPRHRFERLVNPPVQLDLVVQRS